MATLILKFNINILMKQSNFQRMRQKLQSTLNHLDDLQSNQQLGTGEVKEDDRVYPKSAKAIHVTQELTDEEDKGLSGSLTPYLSVQPKSFDDDYELGDTIGQGCHGVVKKCWAKTEQVGKVFAVKIQRTFDQEIMNTTKQTFLLASQLHHPNIIQHIKLYINATKGMACMVMEYFQNPSLEDLISNNYLYTENNTKIIFQNIFETLKYLHLKGICHRDIKPDNILVDPKNGTIKIIDFGVARRFIACEPGSGKIRLVRMITQTGNFNFCAPEIFWQGGYGASIDLWACGVMLYLIFCKQFPFRQDQIMDFMEEVKDSANHQYMQSEKYKLLSSGLKDLIKRLLETNPNKRIQASGALRHPWLLTLLKKSPLMGVKDDLHLESLKKLDKSDQYIKNGLTNSDQMPRIIDLQLSRSLNPYNSQDNVPSQVQLDPYEQSEFVIQKSPTTTFRDILLNFKQSTMVENIFVSNGFSQGINFVKSISSSVKPHISKPQQDMSGFLHSVTFCDSTAHIDETVKPLTKFNPEEAFGLTMVSSFSQLNDQDIPPKNDAPDL